MEERSLWQDLRVLLMNIAGTWYAEEKEETMVFSFCEKSNQDAQLIITEKNKKPFTTVYSVGTYLQDDLEAIFFIDIGADWHSKTWYKIKEASATTMKLVEISKNAARKETGNEILYAKKTDPGFADKIIKDMH